MKKLQMIDLTPEILKEVKSFTNPQDVVAFFASKDYEVTEAGAQKILDYLKEQVHELEDDELGKISGGCGGDDDNSTISNHS